MTDALAAAEAAHVDHVVKAFGDLLQVVVLVAFGLVIEVYLGAFEPVEVLLDVAWVDVRAEEEARHEGAVEHLAKALLLE